MQEFEKETPQQLTLGWISDSVNVRVDALWERLEMISRSAEKSTNVCDVKVSFSL